MIGAAISAQHRTGTPLPSGSRQATSLNHLAKRTLEPGAANFRFPPLVLKRYFAAIDTSGGERAASHDAVCMRMMTVPGVGLIAVRRYI